MHENRETSETPAVQPRQQVGGRRLRPHGPHGRLRGVTLRHSTDESFEQRRNARRRRVRREGCGSRRTLFHLTRTRLRAGLRVSHGWATVRPTDRVGRNSSEIRTGCANQRPSGSVRGAPGNWCPYRDRQLTRTEPYSEYNSPCHASKGNPVLLHISNRRGDRTIAEGRIGSPRIYLPCICAYGATVPG
jgi:hypothetical protein